MMASTANTRLCPQLLSGAGAAVSLYEGMGHEFAVRGDFTGSPVLKAAADLCLERIVQQFYTVDTVGTAPRSSVL